MKRTLLTLLCVVAVAAMVFAQKPYKVVFYNLENLWADAQLTNIPNLD